MARAHNLGLASLFLLSAAACASCKGSATDPPLSKNAPAHEGIPNVPVPAREGPKLFATRTGVEVFERPAKGAKRIGLLRMGAAVARAAAPYSTRDCEGGWYPVRPRGFVCASAGASLSSAPVVPAPALDRALPYRYGTLNAAAPIYERLPSAEEQAATEPDLRKHLAKRALAGPKDLGTGSNDVPVDARGTPTGLPLLAKSGQGVDDKGSRTTASYFADVPTFFPPPTRADQFATPLVAGVLRKGAGVAVADVISSEGPDGPRSFAVLPSGQFVALDRLDPQLGSTWHGIAIDDKTELPIAFTLRHDVTLYDLDKSEATKLEEEEIARRSIVELTGKFRTIDAERYDEVKGGHWIRARDIVKVVKRSKLPDFVTGETRWVDVSLALQTLTLYEGKKPVYVTMISSGADVLGDAATSAATPRGTFPIERAAITARLDAKEVQDAFEVLDVPWSLGFAEGAQSADMFGAYFSDRSGEAHYHHGIALTPIDAKRVFTFAAGEPPEGWAAWDIPEEQRVTMNIRP